ncbi:MAG: methyltransferase family protein [Candidatus Thorarchaeota archaeon]
MIEYLMIVVTTGIFGLQHSGLAAHRIKNRIIDRWGKKAYSRIFTLSSIAVFMIAFLSTDYRRWFSIILAPSTIDWPFFIIGLIMGGSGVIIALRASKVISISTVADMRTDREPELITEGIYASIRHPLYLTTVLVLLAVIPLYMEPHIALFGLAMSVYTIIGAYLEERKLTEVYGQAYLLYRKQAGFILPKLRRRR